MKNGKYNRKKCYISRVIKTCNNLQVDRVSLKAIVSYARQNRTHSSRHTSNSINSETRTNTQFEFTVFVLFTRNVEDKKACFLAIWRCRF